MASETQLCGTFYYVKCKAPYGFRGFVTHTIAATAARSTVTNAITNSQNSQKCERDRVDSLKRTERRYLKIKKHHKKRYCFVRGVKMVITSP